MPGLWIALATVDGPIGAYHDWDYPPTRHDRVLLRLPDAPSTLEFRLYRVVFGPTELLVRSTMFLPAPQPASLHAPAEVAIGSRFTVAWTGPDRTGDAIVLISPTSVAPAGAGVAGTGPAGVHHPSTGPATVDPTGLGLALASAPTAAGHTLYLDAPWAPGRYDLKLRHRRRSGRARADRHRRRRPHRRPSHRHLPRASERRVAPRRLDAEVAAALPMARRAYRLDHADYTATATVTGSDGSVHTSYTNEVVNSVTGERQRLTGNPTARFSWTGCNGLVVGLTY